MWGATFGLTLLLLIPKISIHAPRVGSDNNIKHGRIASIISIHAPRVGSDLTALCGQNLIEIFQSTLPVWGATGTFGSLLVESNISIHAPRVGSDR